MSISLKLLCALLGGMLAIALRQWALACNNVRKLELARRELDLRLAAREDAYASDQRFRILLDEAYDAILTADSAGRISYCNNSVRRLYAATTGLIGTPLELLFHASDKQSFATAWQVVRQHGGWLGEVLNERADGQPLHLESHWTLVREGLEGHSVLVISRDIGARKQAQHQLENTLSTLQDRNRELREFAFVASHDLQEPLRKVRAYCQRLAQRYGSQIDARGVDYIERMAGAVARMERLINDLLKYSRVLAGRQRHVPVALDEVVRGVLSDLEVGLREAQARVDLPELPVVTGDPTHLRQVFQNLIGNALKYRSVERQLHVRLQAAQIVDGVPYWEITVGDNGIGFSNEDAAQIFAPFHRLHGRADYEGTGMGLAIVRRIVHSYGGQIRALGRPGEGADLILRLPVAAPERTRTEAAEPSSIVAAPGSDALPSHIGLVQLLEAVRLGAADAPRLLAQRYANPVRELLRRHGLTDESVLAARVAVVLAQLNAHVHSAQIIDSRSLAQQLRLLVSRFGDG